MKKIFLVASGGHCRSCIDVVESTGKYIIAGIFDSAANVGKEVFGYKVVGTDVDFARVISSEVEFLIAVGQIKSADHRKLLYEKLKNLNAVFATVISPRAYVSPHATLGRGTIVMHDALVNAGAQVGVNCILNTKSLIEHDAKIGNHCHISTAAIVNGDCIVEEQSFIGSNTVLKQGVKVPAMSVISAGGFYRGQK